MTNPEEYQVIPGDPFGSIKEEKKGVGPSPRECALIHARDDLDAAVTSHHHSLGIKHTQASPGDHAHDGKSSRKVGTGLNLTLTGAKGGNVALANLITMLQSVIEFTDSTT